jgi:hypothetical protein
MTEPDMPMPKHDIFMTCMSCTCTKQDNLRASAENSMKTVEEANNGRLEALALAKQGQSDLFTALSRAGEASTKMEAAVKHAADTNARNLELEEDVQALEARLPTSWPSPSFARVCLGWLCGCSWLCLDGTPCGRGAAHFAMSPNAGGRSFAGVQVLEVQRIVALQAVTH